MVKCVSALNRIDETKEALRDLNIVLGLATGEDAEDLEDIQRIIFLAQREIQQACDDLAVSHSELRKALKVKDEKDMESD